jgi:hypothetical protein
MMISMMAQGSVEKVATASTCPSTTAGLQQQEQMVDDVPIRDMHASE